MLLRQTKFVILIKSEKGVNYENFCNKRLTFKYK